MKKFLIFACLLCCGVLLFHAGRQTARQFAGNLFGSDSPSESKGSATRQEKKGVLAAILEKSRALTATLEKESPPRNRNRGQRWKCVDGSEIDAVLVAADAKVAQLRLLKTQRVHSVKLDLLAEEERREIQDWVQSKGRNGIAGYPIRLKNFGWPSDWRGKDRVSLQRIDETNVWRSPHFDITNSAGVSRDALESIANICESVDGALSALPLPLPVNWGRSGESRRKIVIERLPDTAEMGAAAGCWDGQTGIVHINIEHLFEHDRQSVVFEFDKPQKRQKYDTIVHEVTHQSMAAVQYLNVPAWVPEGIAEYMAAMQHAPSVYYFNNSYVSVKYHINKLILGDRIIKDRKLHLTYLKDLMNRDILEWNAITTSDGIAGRLQYDEALLLIDYFFHCDHPDGLYFRRYLEAVLSGLPETEARSRYLLRGRSYQEIENELFNRWKGLGFTINFQNRGELRPGDAMVDWNAEDIQRSMAARRAFSGE